MDRALKERTIGAVVLVIFAVLVVPVFLDGPEDDRQIVSEAVTLPGQNGRPRRQQTIVLERDRDRPVPSAEPAAAAADEPQTTTAASDSQPAATAADAPPPDAQSQRVAAASGAAAPKKRPAAREPARKPAAPPASDGDARSETGLWAVQLGSFSNRQNAERLAADLRGEGYAAFLSRLDVAAGELHRVRVGPQENRDAAESVAQTLASAGHSGQVVPHP